MEKVEDVLFVNRDVFGDIDEHYYNVECYDGWGLATPSERFTGDPEKLVVVYPTRDYVLKHDMSDYILKYRGLHDLGEEDITFEDIMMAYGVIEYHS